MKEACEEPKSQNPNACSGKRRGSSSWTLPALRVLLPDLRWPLPVYRPGLGWRLDVKVLSDISENLTVLPCFQRFFCKLIVGLVRSSDYDEFDVLVVQNIVQSRVDGSRDTEPLLEFPSLRLWIPLQDGVQGDELWEGEDEWHMEGETGQASSQDASPDRFHMCCSLLLPRGLIL